jgi:MoxR-like ATPase
MEVLKMSENIKNNVTVALKEDLNVLLRGAPGIGKTTMLEEIGKELFDDIVVVNCGLIAEPEDWFCKPVLSNDSLNYEPVFLAKAKAGSLVIFDELNRVQNERAMNALYPVLDYRRSVYIPQLGKELDFHGVAFAATINDSEDLIHTGTVSMDTAIYSRFVSLTLHSPDWESVAKHPLVGSVASNLRGAPVSYRQIMAADKLIECGIDEKDAIIMAFSAIADEKVLRNLLEIL